MPRMPGMIYLEKTHEFVDKENGRVVPAERIDEYAREKLDEALDKLCRALVDSTIRAGENPLKVLG
jgi:hypothetical protein